MDYHSTLNSLEIYKIAISLSDIAWNIYKDLPKTLRYHIGDQLLRCSDSIGANIAEGNGRFHFKDKLNFLFNSRGSLIEAYHWILLLKKRKLIDEKIHAEFQLLLDEESKKINGYISYLKKKHNITYK